MSIGSYYSDPRVSFEKMPVEYLLNPLKKMQLTAVGVANKIGSANLKDTAKIIEGVQTWWGITLTKADVADILSWSYMLVVTVNGSAFRLPVWKNEMTYAKGESTVKKLLCGVVVYAPKTNRV
jgi:hypothetical protein